jgi:hypothetical protein
MRDLAAVFTLLFLSVSVAHADVHLPSEGQQLVCDLTCKLNPSSTDHGAVLSVESGEFIELIDGHRVKLTMESSSAGEIRLSGQNGFVNTNDVSLTLNADGTGEISYNDFSPGLSNAMDFLLKNCVSQ